MFNPSKSDMIFLVQVKELIETRELYVPKNICYSGNHSKICFKYY